jgi:polysaccharide export outer membrane protein
MISLVRLALLALVMSTSFVTPTAAQTPPDADPYVIGVDDVLNVAYWRQEDYSAEVTVRPDGRITLPLIGEVPVIGLTPQAVADAVRTKAADFLQDPVVTVVVTRINSRKVFITGEVTRPGAYALSTPTTVLQLIALAGGLTDFADRGGIVVIRAGATPETLTINYRQLAKLQKLEQNITLRPGDTVVVR